MIHLNELSASPENHEQESEFQEISKRFQQMYKKTMKMKAELEDVKLENAKLKEENQQTITPFELETEMKLRIFGLEEDLEKEKAKSAAKIGQMNSALHDKEAELDKIKLQLFNFYKSSGNLRLETISKAEHDAQIAQLNKTHQSKIAELQKSIETLKNQNKRMNESCVKEKVQSVPKIGSMNAPLKSQTSELDEMNVSFSSKTDELKSETESRHLNARLSKLSKENVKFVDPIDLSQICILNDVIVGGKINYKKLNGKILDVKNLEYRNEKWFADGMEISFENSAFPILIKKHLYAKNLSSTILGRIFCHHLCSLSLLNTTLKFAEYRKLVSSPNLEEVQLLIIVKDENGNRIELDQVWKELSNVKKFEYWFKKSEVKSDTAQKLAKLPPFPKLRDVWLRNVQDTFNVKAFGEFFKKNPTVKCCLLYSCACSLESFEKIKKIEKDMISTLPSTSLLNIYKY